MRQWLRSLTINPGKKAGSSTASFNSLSPSPPNPNDKKEEETATAAKGSAFVLKVLVDQEPADAQCVDIIAVHGLNGDCDGTWTDPTSRVNWLTHESCLRKDIPKARILTFGYNSTTYFSRSDADVRDFASELLAAVSTKRFHRAELARPIVFLCHHLGGLVVKQVARPQLFCVSVCG